MEIQEQVTVCERCGKILSHGDYPFCKGRPSGHERGGTAIQRDEIPGGVVLENYGRHPIRFDSHSERRKYMAENGLSEKEKFCPAPGTDIDPAGIPNPAGYVDDYTRAAGAALMMRAAGVKEWDPVKAGVIRYEFENQGESEDIDAAIADFAGGEETSRRQGTGHAVENGAASPVVAP